MLLRPNLQRLSPDIARASLDYSLTGFIFLFDVTKSKSWSVLDLIWKENTPKRKQRYLDSKFSLRSCEGKKMVKEVMEKQQAKFAYLDMPDFGLDVLLVQPRSYEIFKCFRHKSSSPSHWKKNPVIPIRLLNFGQISCPRSLKILGPVWDLYFQSRWINFLQFISQ